MTEATTTSPLKFERETCSRCGGSGSYSYCEMYGSTCFKCAGKGQQLTKRGAAAYRFLQDSRKIRAEDVRPGMLIASYGYRVDVQSIDMDKGNGKSLDPDTGVWVPAMPSIVFQGKTKTLHCSQGATVELLPRTNDEKRAALQAAIDYQNTLTQAGKPRKRG